MICNVTSRVRAVVVFVASFLILVGYCRVSVLAVGPAARVLPYCRRWSVDGHTELGRAISPSCHVLIKGSRCPVCACSRPWTFGPLPPLSNFYLDRSR